MQRVPETAGPDRSAEIYQRLAGQAAASRAAGDTGTAGQELQAARSVFAAIGSTSTRSAGT